MIPKRMQAQRYYQRKSYRIVTAILGFWLFVLGVYVFLAAEAESTPKYLFGIPIILLAADMLVSAIRGRESLLSKIGPLP